MVTISKGGTKKVTLSTNSKNYHQEVEKMELVQTSKYLQCYWGKK